MLETYVKEFLLIVKYIKKHCKCTTKGNFLIADKVDIINAMNNNQYEDHMVKLKIWRGLNWIESDENRIGKRVYFKDTKSYRLCIKINLKVVETLKTINEK